MLRLELFQESEMRVAQHWASVELLGDAVFLMVTRPVNQTQKGTPCGVGVHVEDRPARDRRRCGELTREARSAWLSALSSRG